MTNIGRLQWGPWHEDYEAIEAINTLRTLQNLYLASPIYRYYLLYISYHQGYNSSKGSHSSPLLSPVLLSLFPALTYMAILTSPAGAWLPGSERVSKLCMSSLAA